MRKMKKNSCRLEVSESIIKSNEEGKKKFIRGGN